MNTDEILKGINFSKIVDDTKYFGFTADRTNELFIHNIKDKIKSAIETEKRDAVIEALEEVLKWNSDETRKGHFCYKSELIEIIDQKIAKLKGE